MSDDKRIAKDEPAAPSPVDSQVDDTDDTEGHRRKFHQPAPVLPGQPGPGESAGDDDASRAGPDEASRR